MAPSEDGGQVTFPGQPKEVHVPAEAEPAEAQPEAEEPAEEVSPLEALSQEEFSYRTQDAWEIHGTLYHARNERPSTMIILLHMLDSTRADYDEVVVPLHEALPDADILALDMRGHGESINKRTWEEFVEVDLKEVVNEVVTDQQAKIMRLEELCRSLIDRVRSLGEGLPAGDPADERPPHY